MDRRLSGWLDSSVCSTSSSIWEREGFVDVEEEDDWVVLLLGFVDADAFAADIILVDLGNGSFWFWFMEENNVVVVVDVVVDLDVDVNVDAAGC